MLVRGSEQMDRNTVTDTVRRPRRYEPFTSRTTDRPISRLGQWPCKLDMLPDSAPYLDDADLLIASDCSAFAYGDFHNRFIKGHITVIGCPRHDALSYKNKLASLLRENSIRSLRIVRMEVGCCDGIESAVKAALKQSGKDIPLEVITVTTDGNIAE